MSLLPLAMGANAAGSLVSAYGQLQQGKAAQKAAIYNARLALNSAANYEGLSVDALRRQSQDVDTVRRNYVQSSGDALAALAANGLDVNSASAVNFMLQGADSANYDANTVRENWSAQYNQLLQQAAASRSEAQLQLLSGKSALKASRIGALGTVLGGLGGAMSLGALSQGVF